jgi:hypothetical protein
MFNSILRECGLSPADVRLLRHKDNRAQRGRTPYELWQDNRPEFDRYQATQAVGNESKLRASYWASFVGTPAGETLFVGLFAVRGSRLLEQDTPMPQMDGVDKAGSCHIYDIALEDRLKDLIGRLLIDWGSSYIVWVQRADTQNKVVVELRTGFKEPEFPGFLKFFRPLSEFNRFPQSWIVALRSCRGVYLLTCPRTKEHYVGSATGGDGFWGRWRDYVDGGDGGNQALKGRDPSDYQVSILEVAGTSATEKDVLAMEGLWQSKLHSFEMGLNRNKAG